MGSQTTQKNKYNFYDICFILSAFAGFVILIALPQQSNTFISLGTYTIALCAIAMYIMHFLTYSRRMSPQGASIFLLIVICLIALIFSHSNIGQNLIDLMCFLEIPIFMLCGKEISSKNTPKVFLWLQYALSFYYIYLSGTDKAHCFNGKYGVIYLEELTLSYRNPNETAMYLLVCFISLLIALTTYKNLVLKLLFAINAGFMFYLVWLTACRAGIVICVLAAVGLVFLKFFPVKRIITRTALIIPIIMVAVIYLFNDELVEMQFLGSSVETNRISVFEQVFSHLNFYEIFLGDFATHSFDNLHNAYISIFGTIGIFGVIIYAYFMYHALMSHTKRLEYSTSQKMAYIGVLLIILHSSVEAAFFVGGSAYAMCFVGIYALFSFEEKTDKQVAKAVDKGRKTRMVAL